MWKKWMTLLAGACLMAVMAACGNGEAEKEDSQEAEKAEPAAEEGTAAADTADDADDSETEKPEEEAQENAAAAGTVAPDSGMTEKQLGLTAEEFQQNFNQFAEEAGIEERVDNLSWKSSGSGGDHQIIDMQFDDDRRMQLLAKKGDENVRAVMFSSHKDRDDAIQLIRVLIRTVEPEAAADQADSWIDELGLSEPIDEEDEYSYAQTNSYNFMAEDWTGFLSFVIANKKDPEITKDAFESGDL